MEKNKQISSITTEEMMTFLLERHVVNLPLSELSNIFDKLIWIMDDNGKDIEKVRNKWIYSDDKNKVEIALSMSEVFLFNTRSEFIEAFDNIIKKWPEFSPICSNILEEWDKQHGHRT